MIAPKSKPINTRVASKTAPATALDVPWRATTKIHAVVDANGLPLHVMITGGQQHDSLVTRALLEGVPTGGTVLADKAYDTTEIRTFVSSRGRWGAFPPHRNRRDTICFSPYLYATENHVERFFNRIRHCRRIVTHYEKYAVNVVAFVRLAAIRYWLGRSGALTLRFRRPRRPTRSSTL
jgi:transposase